MASPESPDPHFPVRYGLTVLLLVGACIYGLVGASSGPGAREHPPQYLLIAPAGVELAGHILGVVLVGAAGFGLVAQARRPSRAGEVLPRLIAAGVGVLLIHPGWSVAVVLATAVVGLTCLEVFGRRGDG